MEENRTMCPNPKSKAGSKLAEMPFVHLFFLCLVAYSLVYRIESVNVASRLALTLSIERAGTVTIDDLADVTSDKAKLSGHYYSDKAPGMSLLALPAVTAADRLLSWIGMDDRLKLQVGLANGIGFHYALSA